MQRVKDKFAGLRGQLHRLESEALARLASSFHSQSQRMAEQLLAVEARISEVRRLIRKARDGKSLASVFDLGVEIRAGPTAAVGSSFNLDWTPGVLWSPKVDQISAIFQSDGRTS